MKAIVLNICRSFYRFLFNNPNPDKPEKCPKTICYQATKILFIIFFFVPWSLGGRVKKIFP